MFALANSDHKFSLRAYNDSEWASNLGDDRSTSRSCVYFGSNLVSQISKKQALVARSNTETKYRTLAHTTLEVLWLGSLVVELHIPYLVPTLLCDNLNVVMLSHNPILHARTKHTELDIHFVQEKVAAKQLLIQHISTHAEIADVLTKLLSTTLFSDFRTKIKVHSQSPP